MSTTIANIVNALNEASAQWIQRRNDAEDDLAWIALNNLYIRIESGKQQMSVRNGNTLRCLAGWLYGRPGEETMLDYWQREFEKLPNWYNY